MYRLRNPTVYQQEGETATKAFIWRPLEERAHTRAISHKKKRTLCRYEMNGEERERKRMSNEDRSILSRNSCFQLAR